MASDAVSVFAEGTVEEQAQELINCLAKTKPEEEREKFLELYQTRLHPEGKSISKDEGLRRVVFFEILRDTGDLKLGSDKEIEGYFNLLLSHILSLFSASPEELSQCIAHAIDLLSKEHTSDILPIQYRLLSNTFNGLDKDSPLRIEVYSALVKLATKHEHQNTLQITQPQVKQWMTDWKIVPEKKSAFLKSLSDMALQNEQEEEAFAYLLQHLQVLPTSSPAARDAALKTVASALRLPSIFEFDVVLKSDAVLALGNHELLQLLRICANGSVSEYTSWASVNGTLANEFELDQEALLRKIRSLCFASLASSNIGRDIPYTQICEALGLSDDEIESCVIGVIHSGLVTGKLSQSRRTFHVIRSTVRTFERTEWEALEARLLAWKSGLTSVLDVVAAAQQGKATVPTVVSTQA